MDPERKGVDTKGRYEYYYLLYLLKVLRITKGQQYFIPSFFNKIIKDSYDKWRNERIDQLDFLDPLIDYNLITNQFILLQMFKITRLMIIVILMSYIFGQVWLIIVSTEMVNGFEDAMELTGEDET